MLRPCRHAGDKRQGEDRHEYDGDSDNGGG